MRPEGGHKDADRIDVDGLPHVGAVVYPGQAYYSKKDKLTGELFEDGMACCCEAVTLPLGSRKCYFPFNPTTSLSSCPYRAGSW